MFIWGIEIDLSVGRPGEQSIHRVFVDPGGSHCIAVVVGSGGADTFYTHAKWTKPRVLSKLKGLVVNAVAWNRQLITECNFSSFRPWVFLIHMYKLFWVLISLKHSFYKGSRSWYGQWPASWDCRGWEGQEGEVHQVSVRIYRTTWSFHGFTGTFFFFVCLFFWKNDYWLRVDASFLTLCTCILCGCLWFTKSN